MMGASKGNFPSLILVGTVHCDPGGFRRLFQFLEEERPDLITIEISPYGRDFRARQSPAFRETLRKNLKTIQAENGLTSAEILGHSAVQGIFLLLQDPYEWRAAKAFSARRGVGVSDNDLSQYSKDKLSHLAELISVDNLRTLLQTPLLDLSRQVEEQYRRARSLLDQPPSEWPIKQEVQERDNHMAREIRKLIKEARGKKILHIGGWEHLIHFPQKKSLYGLLEDLRPQRVLLAPKDN